MEARCQACIILGGEEAPCVSRGELEGMRDTDAKARGVPFEIRERAPFSMPGDPCPRAELDPSTVEAARVVGVLLHSDLKRLAPAYLERETRHMDTEGRDLTLDLVQAVLNDSKVQTLLRPPFEAPKPPE